MPQVNNLEEFSNQIEYLLEKYQADPELSKKSLKHQQNLEKLLDKTNKLLEGDDTVEIDQFDNLLKLTQNSYKQMRENNKTDKEFQKKFEKKFGGDVGAGSLNKRVFDKMSMTLSDLSEGVKTLNRNAAKDVGDTALTFAGGPLAKMATEMFDFRGAASALGRGRGDQKAVRGMMHAGSPNVPKEGSYYLDEGERVVSRKDNDVLARFAEKGLKDGIKVKIDKEQPVEHRSFTNSSTSNDNRETKNFSTSHFSTSNDNRRTDTDSREIKNFYDEKIFNNTYNTQEHLKSLKEQHKDAGLRVISEYASPQYASTIADEFSKRQREDGVKLDSMGSKYRSSFEDSFKKGSEPRRTQAMRQHREVIDNSRLLRETVEKSNKELEAGIFLSAKLQYQRFMRNPFFHSGRLLFKTMLSPMKWIGGMLMRFLFGKRMTIQEKQLRAIKEQTQLLQTGKIKQRSFSERGGLRGMLLRAVGDNFLTKDITSGSNDWREGRQREKDKETDTRGIIKKIFDSAINQGDEIAESFKHDKEKTSTDDDKLKQSPKDDKRNLQTISQSRFNREQMAFGNKRKPTFSGPMRQNNQKEYYKDAPEKKEEQLTFLEEIKLILKDIYEEFSDSVSQRTGGQGFMSRLKTSITAGLSAAAGAIGGAIAKSLSMRNMGRAARGAALVGTPLAAALAFQEQSERSVEEIQARGGFLASSVRDFADTLTFGVSETLAQRLQDSELAKSAFDNFIGPAIDSVISIWNEDARKRVMSGDNIRQKDDERDGIRERGGQERATSRVVQRPGAPTPSPSLTPNETPDELRRWFRHVDEGTQDDFVSDRAFEKRSQENNKLINSITKLNNSIVGMDFDNLIQSNERVRRREDRQFLMASPQAIGSGVLQRDMNINMPTAKEIASELGYTLGPSLTRNQQQEIRETQRERTEVPSPSRENIDDLLTYIIVNQF